MSSARDQKFDNNLKNQQNIESLTPNDRSAMDSPEETRQFDKGLDQNPIDEDLMEPVVDFNDVNFRMKQVSYDVSLDQSSSYVKHDHRDSLLRGQATSPDLPEEDLESEAIDPDTQYRVRIQKPSQMPSPKKGNDKALRSPSRKDVNNGSPQIHFKNKNSVDSDAQDASKSSATAMSMQYLYEGQNKSLGFSGILKDPSERATGRNGTITEDPQVNVVKSSVYDKLRYSARFTGSIMSLLALVGQVLYFAKQEFSSKSLYDSYLGMLILRALITVVISGIIFFRNIIRRNQYNLNLNNFSSARVETQEDIDKRKKRSSIHGWLLYLSYPYMLYFGFYRVYKPKDFKYTLYIGYFLEMFLSLIPIIFIQSTTNNTLKIKTTNSLQDFALAIQILVVFEIFFQNLMNFFEWQSIEKLKKEGSDDLFQMHPLPEDEKRARNFKQTVFCSIIGLFLFFLCIGVGMKNLPARQCGPGQGIDNGVCFDCYDPFCSSCSIDASTCDRCADGYNVVDGQCRNCDVNDLCTKCDPFGKCMMCSERHTAVDGECVSCSRDKGCQVCDASNTCTKCKAGFYLTDKGSCHTCDSVSANCLTCNSATECTSCTANVTTLFNGVCNCNQDKNWMQYDSNIGDCRCNEYVIAETNQCQKCEQIVPGCKRCSQTTSYINGQIYIGKSEFAPLQQAYMRCDDCGTNMYLDQDQFVCKKCSQLKEGCDTCNKFGYGCYTCVSGYVAVTDQDADFGKICLKCMSLIPNCSECNKSDACSTCENGYKLGADGKCSK